MNKKPEKPGTFSKETLDAARAFGERLGVDALVFTLVIVGSFGALIRGISPFAVSVISGFIIVAWLANKAINAYLKEREAETRLRELKIRMGLPLLKRRKRRKP